MITSLLMMFGGLIGLLVGSEFTVSAATRLAKALGVSKWVVGLTIASIGTSVPEISTNVAAALSTRMGTDASELAVGNVVGSCISQITLLLGATAVLSPLVLPKNAGRRDLSAAVGGLVLMWVLAYDGLVDSTDALILIGAYVLYLAALLITAEREPAEQDRPRFGLFHVMTGAVGLGVVVFSADAVVKGGVSLAELLGLGRTTIGLMVGLGTGLPELAIALRGLFSNAGSLSLGNLIGSNITDPLLTLGSGAVIHPLAVKQEVLDFDMPAWLLATLVAVFMLRTGRRLSRCEGMLLVLVFMSYAAMRAVLSAELIPGVGLHTLPWVE